MRTYPVIHAGIALALMLLTAMAAPLMARLQP